MYTRMRMDVLDVKGDRNGNLTPMENERESEGNGNETPKKNRNGMGNETET